MLREPFMSTGEYFYHPLELTKDNGPQAVATYIIDTDLGKVSNGKHCRWARAVHSVV